MTITTGSSAHSIRLSFKENGPCKLCGGPANKNGWRHEEGCSNMGKGRDTLKLFTAQLKKINVATSGAVQGFTVSAWNKVINNVHI